MTTNYTISELIDILDYYEIGDYHGMADAIEEYGVFKFIKDFDWVSSSYDVFYNIMFAYHSLKP